MDLGKRKFLQQLGVLTAGASLVPLSQAGIKLSPERREGSPCASHSARTLTFSRRFMPLRSETFTVRRVSYGVGVERVFPVHSPNVAKVELVRSGKVRRSKLYYLRDRVGKAAKVKEQLR